MASIRGSEVIHAGAEEEDANRHALEEAGDGMPVWRTVGIGGGAEVAADGNPV